MEASKDSKIVQILESVYLKEFGRQPEISGAPFWTDAALFSEAGISSVIIGPTGGGLHSAEEWVELDSVAELSRLLAATALEFCNSTE